MLRSVNMVHSVALVNRQIRAFATTANTVTSLKGHVGYEAIMEKAAQIIHNCSYEDQIVNVLHLHAGGINSTLVNHKSRHIHIDAAIQGGVDLLHKEKLASVTSVDFNQTLPYKNHSYRVIACLQPPGASGPFTPSLNEISRILQENGCAVIGAGESMWKSARLMDALQSVDGCTLMTFVHLNCAKEPLKEPYYLSVLVKKTFD